MNDIDFTKENAKSEIANGNYPLANSILENLWEKSSKSDPYLLFDYGKMLRKVNESEIFVNICRDLGNDNPVMSNKWIISTLCWCLYDAYIKNYTFTNTDDFEPFLKRAKYVVDNCEQMDGTEHFKTPYFITIKKVIKIYNDKASTNYKEILKWLSHLDPDKLSEDVFCFQDNEGKEREIASPKEFYYQHMAKSLEKSNKFEDCVIICDTALKQIKKFHYRNHIWLQARMYYCKCMLQDDIETAIEEYKNLAQKENYWFMFHKISQICFRYNKINDALLYACKAYNTRFEHEKMVNLLFDTALLWQAKGDNSKAIIFFQATAFYRNRQGWFISEELNYVVSSLNIDIDKKPDINQILRISKEHVASIEGTPIRILGEIINILPHGKAGFIKPKQGSSNIYFNVKDVSEKRHVAVGDIVEYDIKQVKDNKTKAVNISKRK